MLNYKRLNKGSSLIEVLVAIVIVGLVVTGAMISISYSMRNSAEARYREVASQLAQDGMEVVKLRREIDPWSTFYTAAATTPRGICDNDVDYNGSACGVTLGNKAYTRSVSFSRAAGPPQMVTAIVRVTWQSESNQTMSVDIEQQFSERAL
jgi:prepilin-type N-terminal cleavage/methylation domain-containing protein